MAIQFLEKKHACCCSKIWRWWRALTSADGTMLQLSMTPLPSGRALVSVFVPEHAVEGFQLGTLVEDLGWLEPFGLSGAKIT
jgi:hypothetical protein